MFVGDVNGGAIFDVSGRYRYRLWRKWDPNGGRVCFVLLNPSTADAERDDPTIRRCIGFARARGFGGMEIVNLFAFRATRPAGLRAAVDPIGPDNDAQIAAAVALSAHVFAAWGCHGAYRARDREAVKLLPAGTLCLGLTRSGQPRHPLYLPAGAAAIELPLETLRIGGLSAGDTVPST